MVKPLIELGAELDGFKIGECVHQGGAGGHAVEVVDVEDHRARPACVQGGPVIGASHAVIT